VAPSNGCAGKSGKSTKANISEVNMFRTVGYVFLVLLIGTFAIAWSSHGPQKTANRAETLTPDTMHQKAGLLPVHQVNDMTFIYTDEK
jgi:hypothetical protein